LGDNLLKKQFKSTTLSGLVQEIKFFIEDNARWFEPQETATTVASPSPVSIPKPEKQVTVHSPIGASSMHRWVNCPGSVQLSENQPSTAGEAAKEGTLAHSCAEMILAGAKGEVPFKDDEMQEHVDAYVEFLRVETHDATYFGVEKGFQLIRINPKLFGTCDAVAYFAKERLLRIYDFKYGKTKVDVEENEQLMYYALGALQTFEFHVEEIELVVVQPRKPIRGQIVRRWRFNAYPKMNDFASLLYTAAKATEAPNAPLLAGDWCYWCNARNICPAKHDEANKRAADVFADA
jgi:hypothetical protein